MTGPTRAEVTKRYVWRFVPAMMAYAVILMAVVFWFQLAPPQGWLRYFGAVLPALPLLVVIWAMGAYMAEEPDEFHRTVMVHSVLWGLGGVLVVTTVWGFLETFASTPRLPLYLVFPLFAVIFGAAQPLVRRRFQ